MNPRILSDHTISSRAVSAAHARLRHRFVDAAMSSVDVGYRKPSPRIFEAAVEAAGCSSAGIVVVGNSEDKDINLRFTWGCARSSSPSKWHPRQHPTLTP